MTGTVVTTSTQSGAGSDSANTSGQVMLVGLAERGPVDRRVVVRSLTEFVNVFGERVSYSSLYDQVSTFFGEGGTRAVIARIVGPSATRGQLSLLDSQSGSPDPTLLARAAGPGAYSTDLSVAVSAGTQAGTQAGTFKISVYYKGTKVQVADNLSTPGDAVQAFSNSTWVNFEDQASPASAPDNQPDTLTTTALSAGTDDRTNVTDQIAVDALDLFENDLGAGAVAIPGRTGSTIFDGIAAHCTASNRRVGLLADVYEATKTDLLTTAADLDSEYLGLFAPWVRVKTPAGTTMISPEGYVAGVRARAHRQVGPWRTPMGNIAVASTILGLDTVFTPAEIDELNDGRVSPIKFSRNTYRLYGWRSLSLDEANYFSLKDRDLLNYLVHEGEGLMELAVGEPIDSKGHLQSQIKGLLVGLVDPIAQAGGLYALKDADGREIDPPYKVDTSSSVNPPEQLAANTIAANVYVRVSPFANTVLLNFIKVNVLSGI